MPTDLPLGSPDGLWISTEDDDYIFVERRLVPVHQQQVICHEFGHVICDHEASPVITAESSKLLLPSLNPDMVRRVLGREHSHTDAEIEAELVGSVLGRQISTWDVQHIRTVPPEAQALALRLAALENPASRGRHEQHAERDE
ncbi:ImmA/IrrE family metallo-endopeptidase [Streptomyces puniciscabiei]